MGSTRDKLKRVLRKTVKWGGAGLTVLLLVVWIGSAWGSLARVTVSNRADAISGGRLFVYSPASRGEIPPMDWQWRRKLSPEMAWWFRWELGGSYFLVAIPLWPPALLSLLATAAAWRADWKYMRRVRVGLCAGCGYDRAGLAAISVCPECGEAAEGWSP